jgi:hypothetical protein
MREGKTSTYWNRNAYTSLEVSAASRRVRVGIERARATVKVTILRCPARVLPYADQLLTA